jgi:hypothetical protein
LEEKKFGIILPLFANFEEKCGRNCQKKTENVSHKRALELNFATINGLNTKFSDHFASRDFEFPLKSLD